MTKTVEIFLDDETTLIPVNKICFVRVHNLSETDDIDGENYTLSVHLEFSSVKNSVISWKGLSSSEYLHIYEAIQRAIDNVEMISCQKSSV